MKQLTFISKEIEHISHHLNDNIKTLRVVTDRSAVIRSINTILANGEYYTTISYTEDGKLPF